MKWFILVISVFSILESCISPNKIILIEEKAIQFLGESKPNYDFIYLYKNLSEKLCWPELYHVKNFSKYEDSLKKTNDKNIEKTLKNIYLYKRIYDSGHKIDSLDFKNEVDLNLLSLKALYCDCFKIDSVAYINELLKVAELGEYYSTHTLLIIHWLKKFKCFSLNKLSSTEKALLKINKNLIKLNKNEWNDIRIEAAALIQANGHPIPPLWIKQISKNQNEDGGWSPESNLKSSTHTTILALWTLGEYRRKLQKNCRFTN